MKPISAKLLLTAVFVARGTSFLFSKILMNTMSPMNILAVRFILAFLVLAVIFHKKHMKKTETIFLIDVSDSMKGNITQIEDYLKKTIAKMPDRNMAGLHESPLVHSIHRYILPDCDQYCPPR